MTETCFAVGLLLRAHMTVFQLLHHHDLLLFRGNEHHHTSCEISTLEGVLTKECQWLEVGQIRVKENKGDITVGQLVGEDTGNLQLGRYHDDAIRILVQTLLGGFDKRWAVEAFVIQHLQRNVEVASACCRCLDALFNLVPIGLAVVQGDDAIERVVLVVCQC